MWIRYGSRIINTGRFLYFFIQGNKLLGQGDDSKIHVIAETEDKKDINLAIELFAQKLGSE